MRYSIWFGLVFAAAGLAGIALLGGCSSGYALRGKVVEGGISTIAAVDRADDRLAEQGVGDVQIRVYRDPGRLSQELAATGVSHADGSFEIAISAFGAGWMDEEWLIQTYREGYANAETVMRLPGDTVRRPVLIQLRRGAASPMRGREDLMEEIERYR